MLRVNIVKSEPNYLEVVVQGETHTLFSPLVEYLLKHPDVEYAMYDVDHPLTNNVKFRLRTRTRRPIEVLREVISKILSDIEDVGKGLVGQ